jgi:hypothetical protein
VLQLVVSALLVLSGIYVGTADGVSAGLHLFGWALVVVGLLGLLSAALLRRRP